MGIYLNPGNSGFQRIINSDAAQLLCAYYDCSCDSHGLFDEKEIAGAEGYLVHLNQYHVMNLDITTCHQAKGLRMWCICPGGNPSFRL